MTVASAIPAFCQGIQHFGENLPNFEQYATEAAIKPGNTAISSPMTLTPSFKPFLRPTHYVT
jgi:phosphoketolase